MAVSGHRVAANKASGRKSGKPSVRARRRKNRVGLAAVGLIVLVFPGLSVRAEDDIVAKAKAYVQQATARADKWNGPTTGPKAQASKNIICVLSDSLNGGVKGVADGLAEAAKAIGWNFQVIDGRGEVEGRRQALEQAIALKPQGIVINGFDAKEQQTLIDRANAQRIDIVGWHAGATPGPLEEPQLFVNVASDRSRGKRWPHGFEELGALMISQKTKRFLAAI